METELSFYARLKGIAVNLRNERLNCHALQRMGLKSSP